MTAAGAAGPFLIVAGQIGEGDVGGFDLDLVLQRLENTFGPKVLPMS